MSNYNHCLRPEFTESIVKQLLKGASINLYGTEKEDTTRTLEDIRTLELPNVKIVCASIKGHSYNGLVDDICGQLCHSEPSDNLFDLLNSFVRKNSDTKLFLFLDCLDCLFDPAMDVKGYKQDFFDNLNSLKNKPNVSLLITSKKLITTYYNRIEGNSIDGSFLEVETKELPKLSLYQIESDLKRRFDATTTALFEKKKDLLTVLVKFTAQQQAKIAFMKFIDTPLLQHCSEKIEGMDAEDFKALLKVFKSDYEQSIKPTIDKRISKTRNWFTRLKRRTNEILGISEDAYSTVKKWKKIAAITILVLTTIFSLAHFLGERILNLLNF